MTMKEDFSVKGTGKQKVIVISSFVLSGQLHNLGVDELNKLLDEGWSVKKQENITPPTASSASLVLFTLEK